MTINYVDIIAEYFPTYEVRCDGDPAIYANIVWEADSISQAELDATHLSDYKSKKIMEFAEFANNEIIKGFVSSALGNPYFYDSELEDQINLIGAVTSASEMYYSCREYTKGYQTIDFAGAIVGTNSTGLLNDGTLYTAEMVIDGNSTYISEAGSLMQTFDALISTLNADVDFSAVASASIVNGNINITSNTRGSLSTVNIIDVSLFNSISGYSSILSAFAGIDGNLNPTKEYQFHTNAQLLTVINDGKDVKLSILQKFNVKKQQVMAAVDFTAVDLIAWT